MSGIDGQVRPSVAALWRRFYPEDSWEQFEHRVAEHLEPASHVLEIGAGTGRGGQIYYPYKGRVARYVGVDIDPRVVTNPHLDEGVVGAAEQLPFDDDHFDVVFHNMVQEHLEDPDRVLGETARVLRPGGWMLVRTCSRHHYAMVAARLTPKWFHDLWIQRLGSGLTADHVFEVWYRMNDRPSIEGALARHGLEGRVDFLSVPPGYLRFSRPSFLLGVAIDRLVERRFEALRGTIVIEAQVRRSAPTTE